MAAVLPFARTKQERQRILKTARHISDHIYLHDPPFTVEFYDDDIVILTKRFQPWCGGSFPAHDTLFDFRELYRGDRGETLVRDPARFVVPLRRLGG